MLQKIRRSINIGRLHEMNEFIHKLRFTESILGSAPQAILQICILTLSSGGVYAITGITISYWYIGLWEVAKIT